MALTPAPSHFESAPETRCGVAALALATGLLLTTSGALAQGQDSKPYERDLMVIATLLEGGFDNANQSYFDSRVKREPRHRRIHQRIARVEAPAWGEHVFEVTGHWDGNSDTPTPRQVWSLDLDPDAAAVVMRVLTTEDQRQPVQALDGESACRIQWQREAAQFRGTMVGSCEQNAPASVVLSETQLWMDFGSPAQDFELHRVRDFECFADIPGVGGGRDEPYDRYDSLKVHDQGGEAWFTHTDGRRLGVSLFRVDWPINNYADGFTRDSLVVYISEKTDEGQTEHGYAFTLPEADRVGINLKWMLASCYQSSYRDVVPFM